MLGALASMFKTSSQLRLENLALRQQLAVLRRSAPKRLKLTTADRIFWVWLLRVWDDWKSALMIVKAATVVAWHRKGFGLFWEWRIRRGKPGRPRVPQQVRDSDPDDEPQQPALGCTAHSRRVAETGYRDYPTHCRQIHGATSMTPLTNLADVPSESCEEHGIGRLFHGADDPL